MEIGFFDSLPTWSYSFGVVVVMLFFCGIGIKVSIRIQRIREQQISNTLGTMTGALLAVTGLLLAFIFSVAASQHDLRKKYVLDEANAIGTAYLRADLLNGKYKTEIKLKLREYVDIRIKGVKKDLEAALKKSIEIHSHLWEQASSAAIKSPNTNTQLVIESINEIIDVHERRVTAGIYNRIPNSVWKALSITIALAMVTVGLHIGLSGSKGWFIAVIPMLFAFSSLVTLVIDLDRPQGGTIKVGQQSMIDLYKTMNNDLDTASVK
jgi:hypothetical protein